MASDWMELTRLAKGFSIVIEKVRLVGKDAKKVLKIEGEFDLPPLAKLSAEEQIFVIAFIKSDGSLKEMETTFGISYPTVKARLARIAKQFEFVETIRLSNREEIILQLERGEITTDEAIKKLAVSQE
jgi:hypothetical protein